MACAGNPAQTCGGPDRLTAYEYVEGGGEPESTETGEPEPAETEDPEPTETEEPEPTETEEPEPEPTGDPEPTPTEDPEPLPTETGEPEPTADAWEERGCYTDNPGARTLTIAIPLGNQNKISTCQEACYEAGYKFAGVEYSYECFCDTALKNGGGPAPDGDVGCNMACSGDITQICGGPSRLNLFEYTGELPEQPGEPGDGDVLPVTEGLPESWHYHGCYMFVFIFI